MKKRLLLLAGALGVILLLVAGGGLLVLRTGWFREQLRRRVVAEMEKATGGRVELGVLRFDPWRWHVRLENLVVRGKETDPRQPLLRAAAVEVDLKVVSFLKRDVDVAALRVLQAEVRIVVAPDGSTNLPSPAQRFSGRPFTETLLDLAVGRFEWNQGVVRWNDQRYDLEGATDDLRAEVRFDPAGYYDGRLEAGRTDLRAPTRLPSLEQWRTRFRVGRDRIEITEAVARTAASELRAAGSIGPLTSPRAQFRYEATVDARDVAPVLSLPELRSGRLQTQGSFDGNFQGWTARGHFLVEQVSLAVREYRLGGLTAEGDYVLDPQTWRVDGLDARLLGGHWRGRLEAGRAEVRLEGRLEGVRLEALTAAFATPARPLDQVGWTAALNGSLSVQARWPLSPRSVSAAADLTLGEGHLEGVTRFAYDGRRSRLELTETRLATSVTFLAAAGVIQEKGDSGLRFQLQTSRLEELTAAAYAVTGSQVELPVQLAERASVHGRVDGTRDQPRVAATLDVGAFTHQGRAWDSFSGRVEWSPRQVRVSGGRLAKGKAAVSLNATVQLENGRFTATSPLDAEVGVRDTALDDLAALAGRRLPATGLVTAQFKLRGSQKEPRGAGSLEVRRGAVWGEPFDSLRASLALQDGQIRASNAHLVKGKGAVSGGGAFHPEQRTFQLDLRGDNLSLADLRLRAAPDHRLSGYAALAFSGSGRLRADDSLEQLTGEGSLDLRDLALDGRPAADLRLRAHAAGDRLRFELASRLLGSQVTGQAEMVLRDHLPLQGRLECKGLDLATAVLTAGVSGAQFQGSADGFALLSGEADDLDGLRVQGTVTRLELSMPARGSRGPRSLRAAEPTAWTFANRKLTLPSLHLTGEGTDLRSAGSVDWRAAGALQFSLNGAINLAVLSTFDPKLEAAGLSSLNVTVGGTWREPNLSGRLEIRDGSFATGDLPLGLSRANGVVTFSRRRATIQKFTAEAGGGEVNLSGDADFGAGLVTYRLRAEARQVRLRYPRGLSSLLDGTLTLTGSSQRSRLEGQVQITHAGTRAQVDLATILAALKEAPRTPSGGGWLPGTQLNIAIVSAPDIRFDTSIARNLQADVNLRLRGTMANPALLGRINITQGELEFQATRYMLNRGDITFSNPFRIEPLLNLDLETRVGGYDILLTLIGPVQKLNMTYRSEPPLTFNELVTLLAVGRTPTIDPTLAAQQTTQARALTQIGADTLVGQAIAKPFTGRLERFFGVSRLKVDPELVGAQGSANARITLEQQVGRDVTFTYTYSLASAQEQIVRVRWAINRQWSLEVVRDQNGLVGLDFFFKKRFR